MCHNLWRQALGARGRIQVVQAIGDYAAYLNAKLSSAVNVEAGEALEACKVWAKRPGIGYLAVRGREDHAADDGPVCGEPVAFRTRSTLLLRCIGEAVGGDGKHTGVVADHEARAAGTAFDVRAVVEAIADDVSGIDGHARVRYEVVVDGALGAGERVGVLDAALDADGVRRTEV